MVPDYLPSEKLFYVGKSAWSPNVPDENMTNPSDRVEARSNNFGYVMGLTDTSNPSFPLIADAPATASSGAVYSTDQTQKGGVWKGKKAIVIRCDQSGAVEKCVPGTGNGTIVKGPVGGQTQDDIFKPNGTVWLGATNKLLLPNTP